MSDNKQTADISSFFEKEQQKKKTLKNQQQQKNQFQRNVAGTAAVESQAKKQVGTLTSFLII